MKQKIEQIKRHRAFRAGATVLLVAAIPLSIPLTSGAIDRQASTQAHNAQVQKDIKRGYYTQSEYDCDFDDCLDNEVYLASAQKAVSKYANETLYRIKQMSVQWEAQP